MEALSAMQLCSAGFDMLLVSAATCYLMVARCYLGVEGAKN